MIALTKKQMHDPRVGSAPFLWCLLFGSLYFMVKGVWLHFFLSLVFAIVTVGISILIYPFFARRIVAHSLYRKGLLDDPTPVVVNVVNGQVGDWFDERDARDE